MTRSKTNPGEQHGHRRSTGGARWQAEARVLLRGPVSEIAGWALNVSRGGVRVVVEEPLDHTVEYDVLVGDSPARRGRVAWIRDEADGQILGIQYLDADGELPPPDE